MENDALRQRVHAAMDECFACTDARPSQKYRILNRIEEEVHVKKRIPMRLVFAVVALLALCGGVIAAEMGIFGQFGMVSEGNSQRLAHLDEAASAQPSRFESGAGFALTLEQTYCDGARLYFTYTLEGDGFTLGDGADLEDGTGLTIWDRGDETDETGVTRGYQEVELPEGYAAGEAMTVVLTVIDNSAESGARFTHVPFTVVPTARTAKTGSAAFDEYAAQAVLYLSDVEIYGEVDVTGQPAWRDLYMNRADTDDVDYVVDYQLIADGEVYANHDYTYGDAENGYGIPVRYDLPENCESLVLRPVRYLSGECPDEDIALR